MTSRRHHYIPQMLLRNFTDARGLLWFWRRDFAPGEVKAASPEKLFVDKDIYSTIRGDGGFDDRLERELAELEAVGADFLRQFLGIVRRGQIPNLASDAWEFWRSFTYVHMKRSPRYMSEVFERSGARQGIADGITELAANAATEDQRADIQADSKLAEALARDLSLGALAKGPSQAVSDVLLSLGLSVFTAPAGKSYVVSDLGFARARVVDLETLTGSLTFIPVAADTAIGFSNEPNRVSVTTMSREDVRRMNAAMAGQSHMFAGSNANLLRSLSRAVPYTGIPAFAHKPNDGRIQKY